MTKKHFKLIAEVISAFETPYGDLDFEDKTKRMRKALAEDFAKVLKYENPNFDKMRFMAACGVE